jgi:uncharacterized protein YciI
MMAYFAVVRRPGPHWDDAVPMREQVDWDAHAAFMEELVDDGFILLGGPLGDDGGLTVLLIVDAEDEREVEARFAQDPWTTKKLRIDSIEPWEVLLGEPARRR